MWHQFWQATVKGKSLIPHQAPAYAGKNTGTSGEAAEEIVKATSPLVTEPHQWFREARLRDFDCVPQGNEREERN